MRVYNLGNMGNVTCNLWLYYDFNTGTMVFDEVRIKSLEDLEEIPNKIQNKVIALQMKLETVGVEMSFSVCEEKGICVAECFDGKCELWITKDRDDNWSACFILVDGINEDYYIENRKENQFLICNCSGKMNIAYMDISPCIAYMLYSDEKFVEDFMQFVYKYETLEKVS